MDWTVVVVILAAAGLIVSAYYRLKASAKQKASEAAPSPAETGTGFLSMEEFLRVTAHEAGHALVAWHSKVVDEVTCITDETIAVATWFVYTRKESLTTEEVWEVPRLLMAGIAAERTCFGEFESFGAISDFVRALEWAQEMILAGTPSIERIRAEAPPIDAPNFALIYSDYCLTEAENEILRLSYIRAVECIVEHRKAFVCLWKKMAPRRGRRVLLNQREIASCFGPRPRGPK